ncbi:MAG: adenylate/guanylate cyclase domain-containing protein [Moraxellaceae bacterium]|nr:adenylate/guanylate cyclase domain-containing protein [Moraxellaceae bacterium]
MNAEDKTKIASVRRLIARYLAVPDAMAVGAAIPGSVDQLIDDLHRQRTLQVQLFRIGSYIVPTILFVLVLRGLLMDVFWKMAMAVAIVNLLALYLLRAVTWFRGLNTFLFFIDIVATLIMVWQIGVVTAYMILFLPLIIVAMVHLLRPFWAGTLTMVMTAILLGLLYGQYSGAIPIGDLARDVLGDPHQSLLRNSLMLSAAAIFTVVLLPGSWVAFNYLFGLLQQREYEVARANDAIRRYVPRQLADEILAGVHHASASPARRKITVVFSDIRGFTDTADQMEPEEFAELLNEYLSEMATIAEHYGGTIDKFVGDAIMVFFGAPVSRGTQEDAQRAVQMSIAMQRRMRELETKWFNAGIQEPFRIRIGVNTGVANVGSFGSDGRKDYTAIGNQVNLAARLQAECPPGKVIISHTTWALVRETIEAQDAGELTVKGVHYPVRTYVVEPEALAELAPQMQAVL